MAYKINIQYLESKGFKKNDLVDNADERLWIWRDEKRSFGFDLLYTEDLESLSIVRTYIAPPDLGEPYEEYLLKSLRIESDDELQFIFRRLYYLNFMINN